MLAGQREKARLESAFSLVDHPADVRGDMSSRGIQAAGAFQADECTKAMSKLLVGAACSPLRQSSMSQAHVRRRNICTILLKVSESVD